MSYESKIFIPFHMADPAGIIFYGHVFTLAHEALEDYIQQHVQIKWEEWFNNKEWFVPIKESYADFKRPIFVGKECQVKVQPTSIGKTSIGFLYSFSQMGNLCCEVKTLHVFCDKITKSKRGIPESIRKKITTSQ